MLVWLAGWLAIYGNWLYLHVSSSPSDLVFTMFGLAPSATALSKRLTMVQMFPLINTLNCLPQAPTYEINYIDRR